MAKQLDPRLLDILLQYDEKPEDALWDCHGTWVVYHRAIERIAAKAGVTFDLPQIIEANSAAKVVAIAVRGVMGDRAEWSFGEAAPTNNKNAYPYAMAEKRAKDRVVLKLVGLHGLAYSEEESDDFKPDTEKPKRQVGYRDDGTRTSYALKKEQPDLMPDVEREADECTTLIALDKLRTAYREKAAAEKWNKAFMATVKEVFERRELAIREEMERLAEANPDELADVPAREALEHSLRMNPLMAG